MERRSRFAEAKARAVMIGDVPVRQRPSPLARRFQQICTAAVARALEGEEMTPIQYAAFPYLRDEPGLDQIGLAARIGIDRTNVGLLVDQLEARGLMERRVDDRDRRVWRLHLTAQGIRFQDRVRPATRRAQEEILSCLTDTERETLLSLLARVVQANDKLARPGLRRRKRLPRIESLANRSRQTA